MTQEKWAAVDRYITDLFVPPDAALDATLAAASAAGLPPIHVAPNQGKLLHMAAKMMSARSILEIGTLAGYSTIWLARALPASGRMVTLEFDQKHAALARDNIARAGLAQIVDVVLGKALDTLPTLAPRAPFDLIFIDADKESAPDYFTWSLRLSHPGSVIIVDNVIRDGGIIDAKTKDQSIQGIRRLNEMVKAEKCVSATAIQTVGSKGYDGFAIIMVNP